MCGSTNRGGYSADISLAASTVRKRPFALNKSWPAVERIAVLDYLPTLALQKSRQFLQIPGVAAAILVVLSGHGACAPPTRLIKIFVRPGEQVFA